ncbi:hypothetical protein Cgig2_023319 [Carnegiea gigantea]|uniref:Pentatricopeptide repeat-containing protein n=1 Tax=Carnegiea gigantea TaxID=171969 RepID=A0A9Q1QBC4_9CARY|nr:hypothetical protein Cgig2_023319 [Carnegiea gigantea]
MSYNGTPCYLRECLLKSGGSIRIGLYANSSASRMTGRVGWMYKLHYLHFMAMNETYVVTFCSYIYRFTPDICSYATLLSAYINVPDMEGAEKFFKRLKQDGIEPNIVTYGTLIKGYAKMNDLEKMMQKYEEMVTSGIKANQTIFTTMMDAYGRNKDFGSAVFWFKEMEVHGCPPDQKAKKVLLSLAKTDEDREEADQLTGNKSNYQSIRFPGGGSIDEDEDEDEDDDSEFSDEIDEVTLSESCEERQ